MASKYVENLFKARDTLDREGFSLSASYVQDGAERMERLENYIFKMHAELYPAQVPKGNDDPSEIVD